MLMYFDTITHMTQSDFPIYQHHPDLVYLDNASTTQKPQVVIDAVEHFVSHQYANIHRGLYPLAEQAEDVYDASKQTVARWMGCRAADIFYTYNATHGYNIIIHTLIHSQIIWPGDHIILGIRNHHASIVTRQLQSKRVGFIIDWVGLDDDRGCDMTLLTQLVSPHTKLIDISHVSNVLGNCIDVCQIKSLYPDILVLVDASQSIAHRSIIDVVQSADIVIWTGHKYYAYTGIGVVYVTPSLASRLQTPFGGGGIIADVTTESSQIITSLSQFEPGTPNLIGAVSVAAACDYIVSLGGYEKIWQIEQPLTTLFLEWAHDHPTLIRIVGPKTLDQRVGVISFVLPQYVSRLTYVGEQLGLQNICIRTGGHCAHPLLQSLWYPQGLCRVSLGITNTTDDLQRLFHALQHLS